MYKAIFALMATGTLVSVFTTSVLFPDMLAGNPNSNSTTFSKRPAIPAIPAMLQEYDDDDNNRKAVRDYNFIRQVHVQPYEALLTAAENVSARPSELKSLTLENEYGHPVFSADIFDTIRNQFVDVMINAINGKVLRIDQDQDDNSANGYEKHKQ
jgi:hypothetical protein